MKDIEVAPGLYLTNTYHILAVSDHGSVIVPMTAFEFRNLASMAMRTAARIEKGLPPPVGIDVDLTYLKGRDDA